MKKLLKLCKQPVVVDKYKKGIIPLRANVCANVKINGSKQKQMNYIFNMRES